MDVLFLMTLVAVIAIAYFTKVNAGLVGLGVAFVLNFFVNGLSGKALLAYFPVSLTLTLMSMTMLFGIAKTNGTMAVITEKICAVGKKFKINMPFLFYLLCSLVAAAGPGTIITTAIVMPMALAMANKDKKKEVLIACSVIAGSNTGGLLKNTPSGAIAYQLSSQIGMNDYGKVVLYCMAAGLIQFVFFFVINGGFKLKYEDVGEGSKEVTISQKITMIVLAAAILSIAVLKTDTAFTSFFAILVLLLLKTCKQDDAIKSASWSTIILIAGMSTVIGLVDKVGGIDLLANLLSSMMSPKNYAFIMTCLSGVMSMFSSASGVVMPTLIPTVPTLALSLGGEKMIVKLIATIVIGSHAVTFSPLSTMGSLAVANSDNKDDLFSKLLIGSIMSVLICAILLLFI